MVMTMNFNPRTRTGYDSLTVVTTSCVTDFNPRTRTGYDLNTLAQIPGARISIHVPARGTTTINQMLQQLGYQFQSTYPHGVRRISGVRCRGSNDFNPRTRTGYDTPSASIGTSLINFNPRTRTGYDGSCGCRSATPQNFNPRTRTGYDFIHGCWSAH